MNYGQIFRHNTIAKKTKHRQQYIFQCRVIFDFFKRNIPGLSAKKLDKMKEIRNVTGVCRESPVPGGISGGGI